MSSTVSSFLNNVPATNPEYPLAQTILSNITAAANTTNTAAANRAKQALPDLLNQLLESLIDRKRITPATILALVAAAAPAGATGLPDAGITGTVAVSGSAVTVTSGTY